MKVQDLKIEFSPNLNTSNADFLLSNDHTKVLLITNLLKKPADYRGPKKERLRYRPTEFKTLNAMYQLNKNLGREWTAFACGKKKIGATKQKIGRKSITRFICGDGLVFFKKTPRFKATNIYELEPWVIDVFRFFEKKGMMHGIVEDFEKWRKKFLRRLKDWLDPLLEKGHSLQEILMNKLSTVNNLSTEKPLKGADPKPLKGAGMKPSGSHEAFQGFKSKSERVDPILSGYTNSLDALRNRFRIKEGDLQWLVRNVPLKNIDKGIRLGEEWLRNGMVIESPIRTFMGAVKKACSSSARA